MFSRTRSTSRSKGWLPNLLYKFLGGTSTGIDGARSLTNTGFSTDANLLTGQALFFDGATQYFDTGYVPDLTRDYTFLCTQDNTAAVYNKNGIHETNRFYMGFDTTGELWLGIKDQFSSGVIYPAGTYNLAGVYKNLTVRELYVNGSNVFTGTCAATGAVTGSFLIGRVGTTLHWHEGFLSNYILIPKALTPTEIAYHNNNMERTLYWEGGVLKSDILDQATIDLMIAGHGFAYVMSENTAAGAVATNLVTGSTAAIISYASTMRTLATGSQYGYQRGLSTVDANGVPTGLEAIDVQSLTITSAQSQFLSENGLVLTDNAGTLEITEA